MIYFRFCRKCGYGNLVGSTICCICRFPLILYDLRLREIPNNDVLDNYLQENKMPQLNVVLKNYPDQAKEPATYEILACPNKEGYIPVMTRTGRAIILSVKRVLPPDPANKMLTLFVPFYDTPSNRTNLSRLGAAWSFNTDKWVGHRVKLSKDAAQKALLEAVP